MNFSSTTLGNQVQNFYSHLDTRASATKMCPSNWDQQYSLEISSPLQWIWKYVHHFSEYVAWPKNFKFNQYFSNLQIPSMSMRRTHKHIQSWSTSWWAGWNICKNWQKNVNISTKTNTKAALINVKTNCFIYDSH